jgi:DNA-directed RNA polymerase specialized sigma24 family protein
VTLRYFLDCSVAATAARMGCAEGTVKALTHQAIDALRRVGLTDLTGDDDE